MSDPTTNAGFSYQGWEAFQGILCDTLAPLTAEQFALRSAPHLRSVGENVRHIIGARARWFHRLMGIGGDYFADLSAWDRSGQPERSAADFVTALQQSWQVVQATLASWTPADLTYAYPNDDREPGEPEAFTRQWVIWHLIEHDIYHTGEISQILGMHGIKGVDL